MNVPRWKVRKELDRVRKMVDAAWKRHEKTHDHGNKPFICPNIGQVSRCTDSSTYLAARLGGWVYGYTSEDNPTAEVGEAEGGHDFVVVGDRWLVDFWAWDTYQLPDLYDLDDPADKALVLKRYGPPVNWIRMTPENFAYFKKYINEISQGTDTKP